MLKVNELFSGIGAFRKALIRLGIPHEIVGISEIDKYAIQSYEAIFGETRNYGDISKVSKLDYADLWTYGFPCQDISLAGNQAGIIKGQTRSGLLYEVQRLLGMAALYDELPKYLILENVKNLVGKKFLPAFQSWIDWLDALGYNTYWQVLNAKDYGFPMVKGNWCTSDLKQRALRQSGVSIARGNSNSAVLRLPDLSPPRELVYSPQTASFPTAPWHKVQT